jgi:hypothetical protein
MPRYFLNIYNGTQTVDDVGTDCSDMVAVREEAVGAISECVRSGLLNHKDAAACYVHVVDQLGKTIMIVNVTASVETILEPKIAASTG